MTLWLKTWHETRLRLALGPALIARVCTVILVFQRGPRTQGGQTMPYEAYVWNSIYKDYVRGIFVFTTIILGGGTLLQERAHGTSGFTLSLPVPRRSLVAVRALTGLAEMTVLATVPVIVIPAASALTGEAYPLQQAARFGVLWIAAGAVIVMLAQLWSALVANEYVAWTATFLSLMVYEALANLSALDAFPAADILRVMSGSEQAYFNAASKLIDGPIPWSVLAGFGLASLAMLAATACIIQRRDL